MASIEKCTNQEISYHLRHNSRVNPNTPSNSEIDPARKDSNYYLSPEGRCSARECRDYYKKRLSELYVYGRSDVITACEWIITAPKDLDTSQQDAFFRESYSYLNSLYGEKNCIQAIVHCDEGIKNSDGEIIEGKAHLHYLFVPAVENKKYMKTNKTGELSAAAKFPEKLCAYELITKSHLKQFHPGLQKHLDQVGIKCTVHSGVTGGKNRTVEQLKAETKELLKEKERTKSLEAENKQLKEKLSLLEKSKEKTSGWSKSNGWGKDKTWTIEN